MAPRLTNWGHHNGGLRGFRGARRWFGLASTALVLVTVFTYSRLDARTEPRMESESAEADSALNASRGTSGDMALSAPGTGPRWGYVDYSRDFPEFQESPQLAVPEHPSVLKYVHYFQGEARDTFVSALKSSWVHVPQMMEILKGYDIPAELVYLVLVESRFKNSAVSPRGAAGCWQLMPGTARRLGLRVDKHLDERHDPAKSTHAAGRYLRELYDTFHSWPLALAAYNRGTQPILRAVHKHGRTGLSGALPGSMPALTFVAKVYAAITIARDLEGYGFERPRFLPLDGSDFVWVHSDLSLQQVAHWVGTSVAELRALNPSLRTDRVPLDDEAFCLRLPSQTSPKFKLAYQQYLSKDNDS